MEAEEEGDKLLQLALPTRGHNGVEDEARGPPERSHTLNACDRQGRKGGGGPPTQKCTPTARSGDTGEYPQTWQRGTPLRGQDQSEEGGPHP